MRILAISLYLSGALLAAEVGKADIRPPTAVEARDVPDDGGGAIEVTWEPSPSAGVVEYEVLRSEPDGEPASVGRCAAADTKLTDKGKETDAPVDGASYTYVVKAVGPDGTSASSAPSAPVRSAASWFKGPTVANLAAVLIFAGLFLWLVHRGRRGGEMYIRPISALGAMDDAVGRAAEMGRPVLYAPGLTSVTSPVTVAAVSVLSRIAERAARLHTRIKVPNYDPLTYPVTQSIVRQAYLKAGRPEEYNPDDVKYLTSRFLTYAAAVAGIMIRDRTASNFLVGHFFSEALILAETGAATGAVQIGGTDSVTQLPFFITTCDHTMIGEELFAAAAIVGDDPVSRSTVKAHDWFKLLAIALIGAGLLLGLAGLAGVDGAAELAESIAARLKGGG